MGITDDNALLAAECKSRSPPETTLPSYYYVSIALSVVVA